MLCDKCRQEIHGYYDVQGIWSICGDCKKRAEIAAEERDALLKKNNPEYWQYRQEKLNKIRQNLLKHQYQA